MPSALVTGHMGFIGGHLYKRLVKDGWDVVGVDIKGREKDIPYSLSQPIISEDCCMPWHYPSKKVDVIFHLACEASIPYSLKEPRVSNDNNIGAVIEVLEKAKEWKCPVIYSSSSSIYGDVQTPYSLQKSIGEQYLKLYWELYQVPSVALRYFNVYGEGQPDKGAYKLALGIFLKQYKEGKPFTIVGTGEQRRDFVHVDDVVDANLKAYECVSVGGVWDVGTGTNHSINEVCDMIDPKHLRVKLKPRIESFENLAIPEMYQPKIKLESWIKSQLQ